MIGKRRISEYAEAAFQPQHYRALFHMWRLYPRFWQNAWRYFSGRIVVPCVRINDALRAAIEQFRQIDILKIETEGVEVKTVQAIDSKLLPFVRQIFLEANPDGELHGAAVDATRRLTRGPAVRA